MVLVQAEVKPNEPSDLECFLGALSLLTIVLLYLAGLWLLLGWLFS